MKQSEKMTMVWAQFIVWILTIVCTFLFNRDSAILVVVSGVFGGTSAWLFKIRSKEKSSGIPQENKGD